MISTLKATQELSRIKVKSITDPLFIYGAICLGLTLSASLFAPTWIIIIGAVFSGLLIIAGVAFYCYFAIKDPKYLRSETFHLNMTAIEAMGTKDKAVNPISLDKLNNTINPYNTDELEEDSQ